MQTGGSKRHWLFDTSDVESIDTIRDALVHWDSYFEDEIDTETTLAKVLEWIMEDMPEHISECIKLVYLEGRSYRSAARTLNVDHKTVIARCEKGLAAMRDKLTNTAWIAEILRGYIPSDRESEASRGIGSLADVVNMMGGADEPE